MVPNPSFVPDKDELHLPKCQRCVDKGQPCLAGPGRGCYECNQASAKCIDWEASSDEDRPCEKSASRRVTRLTSSAVWVASSASASTSGKKRGQPKEKDQPEEPEKDQPSSKKKKTEGQFVVEVKKKKASSASLPAEKKTSFQSQSSPAPGRRSFDFLFGQSSCSADWLQKRASLKDELSRVMSSIKPEGSADYEDWLRIGRGLGSQLDQALRERVASAEPQEKKGKTREVQPREDDEEEEEDAARKEEEAEEEEE
jgi:hypothetical protein